MIARLAVLSCLLLGSCRTPREEPPSSHSAGPPEDLGALLEPIREKHGVPALAGAIVREGRLVGLGAVGVRKQGSEERVTAEDRWHVGSCTKAMTATLVARLVEEGRLRWDTTIGEAFPDLEREVHEGWTSVTIGHLLAHRSGLPEDRSPDADIFPRIRALEGPMREQRRELVRLVLQQAPLSPPGEEMRYANYGYAIAGAMAEEAAGKTWEDLLREEVFRPLGMSSAGFGAPAGVDPDQPRGHRGALPVEPGPWADNPLVIGPAGTVHLSMADWATFAALHLAGGRGESDFLRPETFRRLHTPPEGGDYALGWVVREREWAGGRVLLHDGSNRMWFAIVMIAPEKNLALLAATNTGTTSGALACNEAAGAMLRR